MQSRKTIHAVVSWSLRLCLAAAACAGSCTFDVEADLSTSTVALRTIADCPVGSNVIEGTPLDDRLIGTGAEDCILGHDGNDVIRGRGGDDYLVGGRGDDDIRGNRGNDQIYGEQGDDDISGGSGDDIIRGGGGDDIISGDDGNDDLHGNGGADEIHGGPGSDQLDGGDGDDKLWGGGGPDLIIGGAGVDEISSGSGDTVVDEVGDVELDLGLNSWPVVESLVPSPTRINAGETTVVATHVSDSNGDALTLEWSTDCDGVFNEANAVETDFTLTAVTTDVCTLELHVSDGRGGDAYGSITIATGTPEVQGEATP